MSDRPSVDAALAAYFEEAAAYRRMLNSFDHPQLRRTCSEISAQLEAREAEVTSGILVMLATLREGTAEMTAGRLQFERALPRR